MFVLRFLARRLLQGALIVFLVSALIFPLLRVVPGDPVRLMAGGMAPEAPPITMFWGVSGLRMTV